MGQETFTSNSAILFHSPQNVLHTVCIHAKLHGPSMFAVKAKIYGVLYKQSSSIALMKHLVIGQRLKTPNFSAFHWSSCGSLVSIGQHFIASRVVHLLKSTETSLITELDQSGPNHQLCMARTAWSDSDQAVRAVHSCNSWLFSCFSITHN